MTQRINLLAGSLATAALISLGACGGSGKSAGYGGLSPKKAQLQLQQADSSLFDNPYDTGALLDRANALAALGQTESAMDDAIAVTELDPQSGEAQQLVAKLESEGVQRPQRASMRSAQEPEPPVALEQPAEPMPEEDPIEEPIAADEPAPEPEAPAVSVDELLALADEQIAAGERAMALATLTEAIETDPESASAYRKRAWLHLGDGYLDAAMDDLDQSLAIDPASASSHELRGYTAVRMEQDEIADASLTRAIDLDTATPNRLLYRGIARTRLGIIGAADDLELAISLGGDSWQNRELASNWLERARSAGR